MVGGGPGGLYAAYTAARRGHKVVLCEATDEVGGLLKGEAAIPFKYEMYQLGGTLQTPVRTGRRGNPSQYEVTREYAEKEAPDAIIVAAGSDPVLPPIPGLREAKNMILAEDYYLEKDRVGDSVIVLGGGLVGCELAVCLADLGKKGKLWKCVLNSVRTQISDTALF